MRILAVGDVVGTCGLEYLREVLPSLKRDKSIDLCIVNGENAADGNGITPTACEHMFTSGADVITTGNHAYRRREMYDFFDESPYVLRPANFSDNNPGKGVCIVDKGRVQVGIINLMGCIYMESLENPLLCADKILEDLKDCRIILVDFHAEATSEKRALGFYLDGRVTAVFGTHTHVQTADNQVLPNGSGYITDLGMVGAMQSVLGVKPEIIINKLKYNMPARFDFENGAAYFCGCIFDVDDSTGRVISTERVLISQ